MAQAAVKICDICASGPGSKFCLECQQYFCDNCKSLHARQNSSKHHKFKDGCDVSKEVKPKCIDHSEDLIFLCTKCNVSACTRCVVGKHKGHEMSIINELLAVLKDKANKNFQSKYGVINEIIHQLETGMEKMNKDVAIAIRDITYEGEKIKSMIDHHVQKIVAYIQEKADAEKEKFKKIISEAKEVRVRLDTLNAGLELLKQQDDAGLINKLTSLNDDIVRVKLVNVVDFQTVVYKARNSTENDITSCMGFVILSKLKLKTDETPAKLTTDENPTKRKIEENPAKPKTDENLVKVNPR